VSNKAGELPYSLYAYDSYGTEIGGEGDPTLSSYKGYDKGPFGYKTGVRQYDPETGRFLSPDPFKGYISDPASQHPYMYCRGNPIRYSDPSGYFEYINPLSQTSISWDKSPTLKKRLEKFEKEVASNSKRWQGFLKEPTIRKFLKDHGLTPKDFSSLIISKMGSGKNVINVQLDYIPENYEDKLLNMKFYGRTYSSSKFGIYKLLEKRSELKTFETVIHELIHVIQCYKGVEKIRHDKTHTNIMKEFRKHF